MEFHPKGLCSLIAVIKVCLLLTFILPTRDWGWCKCEFIDTINHIGFWPIRLGIISENSVLASVYERWRKEWTLHFSDGNSKKVGKNPSAPNKESYRGNIPINRSAPLPLSFWRLRWEQDIFTTSLAVQPAIFAWFRKYYWRWQVLNKANARMTENKENKRAKRPLNNN